MRTYRLVVIVIAAISAACGQSPAPSAEQAPKVQENSSQATFEARGNEPGWNLKISDDTIDVVADYGQKSVTAPTPKPERGDGYESYEVAGKSLEITIRDSRCADDATGMPYPKTVTMKLEGREYKGCGGDPKSLLIGPEWVVEDIDGEGVVDRSHATLEFRDDGRVGGNASCNSYSAQYTLTGDGLGIGQTATTRKACAPALMDQERKFLDILSKVNRHEIDKTGALILHTPGDRTILARR